MQTNGIKLLNRLFRRNESNAVVSELYAKAMNQPLFVHPAIGELVIQSYLHDHVSQVHNAGNSVIQSEGNIAVLDISGALVARPSPGLCDNGPVSYEAIKLDFDTALADKSIETIIGRFDTPGGMASQNMDLTDHIFHSRGKGTKLVAMVDDMAYSAGFALASAFDEIWVTRTSGVGSVGVVSYHINQSEFNDKLGIKIEYIYAGDKKIHGNPHEQLAEEARQEHQLEVTRLYQLFCSTVARNLGMSVEQIKATEAGTFHGENAVDAGFADKVGTFNDLIEHLTFGDDSQGLGIESKQIKDDQAEENKNTGSYKDGYDAGYTAMKLEAAESKQEEKRDEESYIFAMCKAAGTPEAAEKYIESGLEVEQIRTDLLALRETGQSSILNKQPIKIIDQHTTHKPINPASIYQQRRNLYKTNRGK